jgi:hypothetical protein
MSYYTLDSNKQSIPCNVLEWARFFNDIGNRRVAFTVLGDTNVSTVFLGLDHSFGGPVPVLFETLAHNPINEDELMERYTTWEEAVEGHNKMVEKIKGLLTNEQTSK